MRVSGPAAGLAALLFAALAACGPSAEHPNGRPGAPLRDPDVAATVNGKPILIDDVVAEAISRGAIRPGDDLEPTSPVFYQIMENLIETRLMAGEAEARGLDRDSETRHRLDSARERILANVLNEHIARTALRESAIERMYREQVRLLKQGREVRARHILFDSKEAALAAKRRLDAGELFERLAFELSRDPATKNDGGDLGYFLPEAMPDAFREAAQTTDVGKVAGPFQTNQGWHLLKIEEKRDASPPSLENMRPKIVQWLMFDEQRRVVEKLKAGARIARITDQPGGVSPIPGMTQPRGAPDAPERPADPDAAAPPAASAKPPARAPSSDGPPAITFAPPAASEAVIPPPPAAPRERET